MPRIVQAALVLLSCTLFATEVFAQSGQVTNPVPLTAPSINTTTTTCQINCDTVAMDLPEFLRPGHRLDPDSRSRIDGDDRYLQSQLHDAAACVQATLLKAHCSERRRTTDAPWPDQRSCVRRFIAWSHTASRSSSKTSLASCGVVNQNPCASSPSSWPGAQPA